MIQRCSFCSQASGDSWYEAQKVWLVQKEGFTLGEWVQLGGGDPCSPVSPTTSSRPVRFTLGARRGGTQMREGCSKASEPQG